MLSDQGCHNTYHIDFFEWDDNAQFGLIVDLELFPANSKYTTMYVSR